MSFLNRLLWRSLTLFLILSAIIVSLGREMAPLADNYRESLVGIVSGLVGIPLHAERVGVSWHGVVPAIEVHQVQISGASGEQAVSVKTLVVDLNPWLSLWHFQPVLYRLQVIQPEIYLEKNTKDQWQLRGVPRKSSNNEVSLESVFNVLLYSHLVEVKDAHFNFSSSNGAVRRLHTPRIGIDNTKTFHRLTAMMNFDEAGTVQLLLEAHGDHNQEEGLEIKGYVHSFQLDISVLTRLFGQNWPSMSPSNLDLFLWLDSSTQKDVTLKGYVKLDHLPEFKNKQGKKITPVVNDIFAQINTQVNKGKNWRIDLNSVKAELNGQPLPINSFSVKSDHWGEVSSLESNLSQRKDEGEPESEAQGQNDFKGVPDFSIGFSDFTVADILSLQVVRDKIPSKVESVLKGLSPKGQLGNVWLDVYRKNKSPFSVRGNFFNAGVDSWKGSPKIGRANGYFELEKYSGRVVVNSHNGFDFALPIIFEKESSYSHVNGELRWQLYPEQQYFSLYSGLVTVHGDAGTVKGEFALHQPFVKYADYHGNQEPTLDLSLGVENGNPRYLDHFLPKFTPSNLRDWLLPAVQAGSVNSGQILYRGSTRKSDTADKRALQLAFDVSDAYFMYQSEWPILKNMNGRVYVDNLDVNGFVEKANIYDGNLKNIVFSTKGDTSQGKLLNIQGEVEAGLNDGLKLFKESPIKNYVGSVIHSWQASGGLTANLDLHIPLDKKTDQSEGFYRVEGQVEGAAVGLTDLELSFKDIQGDIVYDSRQGLMSRGLSASFWGRNLSASIAPNEHFFAAVDFQSKVDFKNLKEWLKQPLLGFIEGSTGFSGQLTIPKKTDHTNHLTSELKLQTDLGGLSIDLPSPYGKKEADIAELGINIPLHNRDRVLSIDYKPVGKGVKSSNVTADLSFDGGQFQKAMVLIGDDGIPSDTNFFENQKDIFVYGVFDDFDLPEWLSVVNKAKRLLLQGEEAEVNTVDDAKEEGAQSKLKQSLSIGVAGDINFITLKEYSLSHVKVKAENEPSSNDWSFVVDSPLLKGDIFWKENEKHPFDIQLSQLTIPIDEHTSHARSIDKTENLEKEVIPEAESDTPEKTDPLNNVVFEDFPAARVSISSVNVGDDDFGSWQFSILPSDKEVVIDQLRAKVKNMEIGNENHPGKIIWSRDASGMKSQFSGDIYVRNIGDVSKAWGLIEIVQSKKGDFSADLTWPGSPVYFDPYRVEGQLSVHLERGRFLEDNANAENPLLRLVGLFNFDSWARRLRLDFSDLYKSGMSYDRMDGLLALDNGGITFTEPLLVETPSSELEMTGFINMNDETINANMSATLPVGGNLTVLGAIAGGLPAAVGVYVISKIFKKQVRKVASVNYSIEGSWDDPSVSYQSLDDAQVKQSEMNSTDIHDFESPEIENIQTSSEPKDSDFTASDDAVNIENTEEKNSKNMGVDTTK